MRHDHSHHDHGNEPGRLGIALGLSLALFGIELLGARLSGSLSLLADAAHMATDAAAAGLALFAARLAQRPRTSRRTFGYGRSTVIAALVNASTLIAIALSLSVEALHRFAAPPPVQPTPMLIVATIALVGNGGISWLLVRGGGVSLNVRAVLMHLATDALASFGVIVGALLISWTGVTAIDPTVTILISVLVAWSSWGLVRESSDVLMNTAPSGVEADTLVHAIINTNGIVDVHDVHVWSIDGNHIAASLHVRIPQERIHEGPEIVARLKTLLHERFNIEHATIEIECDDCAMPGC